MEEEHKRCWNCKNIDKEYNCWCVLTDKNVILDLSYEDTLSCENYELDNKKDL